MNNKQVIVLELNEVNFEFLEAYAARGYLPNFKSFLDLHGYAETTSETRYRELEPWIQWVTAHTGKTLEEHGVFRLGDIVDVDIEQIWEKLAAQGIKVGAMSPMNAKCRGDKWDFFVPDPWTKTRIIAKPSIKRLYSAIAQVVNDNAQEKITPKSLIDLAIGAAVAASPKNYLKYFNYLLQSRAKPWLRAIFLDQLLSDLFVKSVAKHDTQFATLFLNAAAHIQHHYMFASGVYEGNMRNPDWYVQPGSDPLLDVYSAYDQILRDVMNRFPSARIMLATGLHQNPHPDLTYYWRLKEHEKFLEKIGVPYSAVKCLMSRDFCVICDTKDSAKAAENILMSAVTEEGIALFEVDNRGTDLFVMLSYSADIGNLGTYFVNGHQFSGLIEDVAFVAIKNGQHDGVGYFSDTGNSKFDEGFSFPLKNLPDRMIEALKSTHLSSKAN
jgi:hypothetical protein